MKFRILVLAMMSLWAIGAFHSSLRAQQAAQPSRTVLEGVYTEEQAKRGETIYAEECSSCHGPTLDGGEMAPPLSGGAFMSNWSDLTVGDLFDRIRLTMPDGNPGKLSRPQIVDVVAYVLKVSKFPGGKTELPRETEALKQIKIVAPKP
jgi:mono/diheme cytochrome c family protein